MYPQITSIENLFQAWNEFEKGKRNRKDVQAFELNLEDNLFNLCYQLKKRTYKHQSYTAFNIYDPKFRHIHKATVKDRIVHHAVVSLIEPIFDKTFIYDSYSCRLNKGTHRAVRRLFSFIRKVSKNYIGSCFALKLDIKKFFASVDQKILLSIIGKKITDKDLLWLIKNILSSFSEDRGIPIGNLTSQIFANIYMNELDQYVKHQLRIKYYLRYADDLVILSTCFNDLNHWIKQIELFLQQELKLELHSEKIILRKLSWGIDFLGYIVLPHYILPRAKTKKRIFQKLKIKIHDENFNQSLQSYLGYLSHASSFKLTQRLKNQIWLWGAKRN